MAGNHWNVEQIVREVLRRLQGREEQRDAKRENGRTTAAIAADGRLVLSDRVVGMHSLDGRLEGVRRLIVPHRAVLTPLVDDVGDGLLDAEVVDGVAVVAEDDVHEVLSDVVNVPPDSGQYDGTLVRPVLLFHELLEVRYGHLHDLG